MYKVGAAKTDITYFRKGIVMLGYGKPAHKIKGVETQIYSRAVIIENQGKKICFVNVELGFCTIYLKHGVIQKLQSEFPQLGLNDSNVMITAQHTHSAPGGFGQHFFYNIPAPGFKKGVWEHLRNGIVQSIVLAHVKMKPAHIKIGFGEFNENEEVAFNRSLEAYNANPEIKHKLKKEEWHLACDRDMKLLQFEDEQGKIIANINWFGTHCTSLSNDKYKICSDNKGYAATFFEQYYKELNQDESTICIFAQDACGDVSPNFIYDVRKLWTRGKFKNDYESAKYTGDLQYAKAKSIATELNKNKNLEGRIESIQTYVEFTDIICDPEFTNGEKDCRTSPGSVGISFLEGTVEGPGMLKPVGTFLKKALAVHKKKELKSLKDENTKQEIKDYIELKYKTQSPKDIIIETSKGQFAWLDSGGDIPIPGAIEKIIANIKIAERANKAETKPWIISRLPLQIFVLGNIAIIGIPLEITTVAGRRLRKTLKEGLATYGINHTFALCQCLCRICHYARGIYATTL